MELYQAPETDHRAKANRQRNVIVQILGNLTILNAEFNSAQSNLPRDKERSELMKHYLLPTKQILSDVLDWDVAVILQIGNKLFKRALDIWTV